MRSDAITRFKSHIGGKNADVTIYPDRIEWQLSSRTNLSTGKKLALGVATAGLSLAATGVSGAKRGSEVIPVTTISSVTTEKDGIRFSKVHVICAGNDIGFRVSHNEAGPIRELLTQLVLGSHPSQQDGRPAPAAPVAPSPVVEPAVASGSVADELVKLAQLRDAGVLSADEFEAQKSKLLE